jgi:TolA-binding protein
MAIDWAVASAAAMSIFTGIGAWFAGRRKEKAKSAADVANAGADRAIAEAESTLYNRLRERLDNLEGDVTALRNELDKERAYSRRLERHVWRLEKTMRDAGLEPPLFEEVIT